MNAEQHGRTPRPVGAPAPSGARLMPFVAGAAGIMLLLIAHYARTLQSFASTVAVCPKQFCDFVDYYYPMGAAIFRTGLPVPGFLYSPFVAVLFAAFPPLGLDASLVLWSILQALSVSLYVLLFRRLVPAPFPVQLLFVGLALTSYPVILNTMGGQVSVIILAALLGMLALSERGRLAPAAGLLAFAASFKFYPLIFVAPFAARRDSRLTLFAIAACGAALFGVPALLLGVGDTLGFYGALLGSFRQSGWVATNPHSQFLPHLALRLISAEGNGGDGLRLLLHGISYGVAAANLGLILLIQRARLRRADLWSFQILCLTIPFILKTSWPHDFVFLPFTQAFLAWRLLGGERAASVSGAVGEAEQAYAYGRQERTARGRPAISIALLFASMVLSNVVFFNVLGSFPLYGALGCLFWADLLLLVASYSVLLPPAMRWFRGRNGGNGGPS